MKVLVTISDAKRLALVVDMAKRKIVGGIKVQPEFVDDQVVDRPSCRPFGITWSDDHLYIANNFQLLTFDRGLKYQGTLKTPLQIDSKQLAFHNDRIWAVSPATDSLIGVSLNGAGDTELKLLENESGPYKPRTAFINDATVHFNSLLWANGHVYVAADAHGGQSFIASYDENTLELKSVDTDVGLSTNGIAMDGEDLFWLSAGASTIISRTKLSWRLKRRGFARGFAVTDDHHVVGISQFRERPKQFIGDSWIQLINRETGAIDSEVYLRNVGTIYSLRVLDVYDHAHRVEPFWQLPAVKELRYG